MAINTSQISPLLRPGINTLLGSYNSLDDVWRKIYQYNRSERNFEYDVMMKMLPVGAFRAEGAATQYADMATKWQIAYEMKAFSIGFIITNFAIEDNLYKERFPQAANSLKESLRQTKQIQCASVFNNGFNANFTGGDGVSLFNTQHPLSNGSFLSNTFGVPAQLNETSLQDALTAISYFRDDAGLLKFIKPKLLYVPPQLKWTADVLLHSKFQTNTANNNISAIEHLNVLPGGYVVDQFLTNSKQWQIISEVEASFRFFQRKDLDIAMFTDITTDNLNVRAVERYAVGWSDFRGGFGSQGI